MTYPEGIITRPVEAGSALAVTDGRALTVETVTVASRALIHLATGTRLEKVTSAKASPLKGESLYWVTACTDRSGEYLDADTREIIILSEDEHTHTYTTTLRVLDEDGDVLGTYEIGPYPVPTPETPFAYLDLDSLQVVDVTTGTAIPIPESWTQIVADAEQATADVEAGLAELAPSLTDIADLKTKTTTGYLAPAKVAPLVSGKLPEANVPDRLTETALSATISESIGLEIGNPETDANNAVVTIVNDALAGFSPSDTTIFHVIGDDLASARPATAGAVVWVTTVEGGTPTNIIAGDTVFRVTEEPLPYFTDDFARADGSSLGDTATGGLTWLLQASLGTPSGVIASGTGGVSNTNTSGRTFATVDAGVADGIYAITLAANDSGVQSLVFRYTDANNYLFLNRQNSGSQVWSLWRRVGGSASLVFASATAMATGQAIEVELNGTSVKVRINEVEIINQVVTEQASATRYGFGSITTYAARWDNVSLSPLPA